MSKRWAGLVLLCAFISAGFIHKCFQYKPQVNMEYDMSGIYRGKLLYPSDFNPANSRYWGYWIEVEIYHDKIIKYDNGDLVKEQPMHGYVTTYLQFGAVFEDFKMTGEIDLSSTGGYHNANGSLQQRDSAGNEIETFYSCKITHFETQRQGDYTPCNSIPNIMKFKSCGSDKNHFIKFQFYHTGDFWASQEIVLEKCCTGVTN
jgi:hypothetical protein